MSIFSRIKAFIKQEPKEQIVGHSIPQLNSIFTKPLSIIDPPCSIIRKPHLWRI